MYQLKDKTLEKRAKGHLIMTLDLIYNPIRAAVRTINPREPKVLFEPPKFKRQVRCCMGKTWVTGHVQISTNQNVKTRLVVNGDV